MRANSLGRFVLRVIAWLPLTFAVWYLAAPLFVWPVAVLSEVVTRTAFGDLVKTVEQNGPLLNFVTSLRPGQATSGPKSVLEVESNVLLFTFGLPMFAALILATREPHRIRQLILGYLILLPFETFSVVADFLKNAAILAGPAVASQIGFTSWQREAIAFSYQFGTLILPTVAPAIVWVLMDRRFLESFAGKEGE
jgi:hypothetical protein